MKEIKFEDIKKANESIVTLDVKGKEYAQVNERIKAFRMVYPSGFIKTEIISLENGVCVMRAEVGNEDVILGTGTAYEKENSTFINKTSYIENCETSAVGRALGMAGFGIDTSVCSAEEVQNAIANQEDKKIDDNRLKAISKLNELVEETDTDYDELLNHYKVKSNSQLTNTQLLEAIKILEKKMENK